ncbi:hypothetical protein [Pedobacter roseus]|uniref:Outer membrane beta-barrel protein n=1 Tax=Pedobacter roseus TaxID=336820 RepID=A0A7G9QJW6_9SPHI|nr:hypothetical protein [Pedobacter roseus]QNN43641.1 hypothetical protein H9L23_05985 [Pedobacter roseus]
MLLIGFLGIKTIRAQDTTGLIRHSIHIAPFAGYNSTLKAPVFGGEVGYEFRLNKHWGFTAAMNLGYIQKNNPEIGYINSDGSITQAKNIKTLQNALYAGAKYYIGRFYLSAELGYQEEYQTTNFPYTSSGSSYNHGTYATNGFYQAYGLGYQIPLRKGDNIEIFAKGSGANNTSFTAGFRYSFGLSKRK